MRHLIKRILIITLYIGLVLVTTNVYATTGKTMSETTRLRKEASTNSDTIALISQNTEVEIISEEGEWYKVKYLNYTGYIRKDMISSDSSNENINNTNNTDSNTTQVEQQNETSSTTNTVDEQQTDNSEESTDNTNMPAENQNTVSEQNTSTENIGDIQVGYTGKLLSNLEIKILPLINSSVIATINENTEFTVTDIINKWGYIETENNSGWVLLSKVKTNLEGETVATSSDVEENKTENESNTDSKTTEEKSEETSTTSKQNTTTTKYVSTETLNVRESPENSAKIVSQLTINTQVTVVEVVDSTWSKVKVKNTTGYVASKYLSDTKTTTSSRSENLSRETSKESTSTSMEASKQTTNKTSSATQSTSSDSGIKGADIVSYAKKYLGYRYVSGGTSPLVGFDCSGFTYYVYKHFGITLSRTSTAQASNGVAVSKSNLKAGDLVIFNNSSNSAIGHVGIYIGGNTFIHAANSTKGVITTSLSDSYYAKRYVTARRITN